MKNYLSIILLLVLMSCSFSGKNGAEDPARQWPWFRGYYASGVLDNANIPSTWDIEEGENILWNKEIDGLGLSSPVIWGDKLFITTAISESDDSGLKEGIFGDIAPVEDESVHEWVVYCMNKNTGEMIWENTSYKGVPQIKRHPKSSHANTSLATDGKHVIAFFGSEGLYCYDMDGALKWDKNFGKLESVFFVAESAEWEFASSPIIHDGVVIIQVDVMTNSFVAAFNVETGEEIWKTERDEYPGWCTPNIYLDNGETRVAINGYKHRGAYDFKTGEEIWRMSGGGDIPIPTPIIGHGLIYFNSAHGRLAPIYAVSQAAKGDITLEDGETTNEYIKWSIPRGGAYMHTMLIYGDYLYRIRWNGQMSCFDALTGEVIYEEKLGDAESFTASPVASDGKIYIVSDMGTVYVLKTGIEFEILSVNELDGISMTAPSLTDGIIYFRTQSHLIAISSE